MNEASPSNNDSRPVTVFIRQLTLTTIVGIHPEERIAPQPVVLDLELHSDRQRVYATKNIADTVDYSDVTRRVTQLVKNGSFHLLEVMAEEIADMLLATYSVTRVRVQVAKPRALDSADAAGVRITRSA